jgi:hypothetical protein
LPVNESRFRASARLSTFLAAKWKTPRQIALARRRMFYVKLLCFWH